MSDLDARLSQTRSERKSYGEELECLDDLSGRTCQGEPQYRMPLSASGKSFVRCDLHWDARLAEHERHSEIYPDSPVAPDWFDPEAAGERWDDDY